MLMVMGGGGGLCIIDMYVIAMLMYNVIPTPKRTCGVTALLCLCMFKSVPRFLITLLQNNH